MVRYKRRYALCEIIYPNDVANTDVTDSKIFFALKDALLETHGDLGYALLKSSLVVKYVNQETNMVIIRGSRDHFELLMSSLVFIQKIAGCDAFLSTLYVGGSIRSCQKFIIKYHKQNFPLLYSSCTSDEERAQVLQSITEACQNVDTIGQFGDKKDDTNLSLPTALEMFVDQG